MIYYAKLNKGDNYGYWLEFPDVPGCFTQGKNLEETLARAEEALLGALLGFHVSGINPPTNYEGQEGYYPIPVPLNIAVALKLRWAREASKLSQSEVAKKLDISYTTYQRFESPSKNNATLKTIERLQNVLGVKLVSV